MATNTAKAVPYDRPSDINPLLREGGERKRTAPAPALNLPK